MAPAIKVMICGISTLAQARYYAAMQADVLVFNLDQSSGNGLDKETAGEILQWIKGPALFGLFGNQMPDEIFYLSEELNLDGIILPGRSGMLPLAEKGMQVIWQVDLKTIEGSLWSRPHQSRLLLSGVSDTAKLGHLDVDFSTVWLEVDHPGVIDFVTLRELNLNNFSFNIQQKSGDWIPDYLIELKEATG